MDSERTAHLIFKHVKGKLSAEEDRELVQWRREAAENEDLFLELSNPHYIRETLKQLDYYKNSNWDVMGEKYIPRPHPQVISLRWLQPVIIGLITLLLGMVVLIALF